MGLSALLTCALTKLPLPAMRPVAYAELRGSHIKPLASIWTQMQGRSHAVQP